jgi:hypothetical protein
MNYSVKNQSEVSAAYAESVKQVDKTGAFSDIGSVTPVRYPNATEITVDQTKRLSRTQSVSQDMNEIAFEFSGKTTGYGSDSQSRSYQAIGTSIDVYV